MNSRKNCVYRNYFMKIKKNVFLFKIVQHQIRLIEIVSSKILRWFFECCTFFAISTEIVKFILSRKN